jgi:shikimate kinase
VGEGVATALGRSFLDLDREIERREGMTVAQIFGERGEYAFRQLERALTEELKDVGGMILSPGGGWIASPENVLLLRPPARFIYLRVRLETAIKRLGPQRSTRPLLIRPDPLGELRRLYEARKAAYEASDDSVDTERLNPQQVIEAVAQLVRRSGAA